jgi:hypothetical protein
MRALLILFFLFPFLIDANQSYATLNKKYSNPECLRQNQDFCKRVHRIVLAEFPKAYNPSLIPSEFGYSLFFRFDEPNPHTQKNSRFNFMTYIGSVELDRSFRPISEIKVLDLKSAYCEDPRCILFQDRVHLFYNDIDIKDPSVRKIKMAILDPGTRKILEIVDLPKGKKKIEKNWIPFVRRIEGEERLFFIYDLSLFEVYELKQISQKWTVESYKTPSHQNIQKEIWEREFGSMRGGAPLIDVEGELFCFFHSCFYEKNPFWKKSSKTCFYHMGLITFCEKTLKASNMLQFPLFYSEAFQTPREANFNKWVIYPAGAVFDKENEKIFVSLGENDQAMIILEFDKQIFQKKFTPLRH